jgi:hypothetical protein
MKMVWGCSTWRLQGMNGILLISIEDKFPAQGKSGL